MRQKLIIVLGVLWVGSALVPQLAASAEGDYVVIVHRQSPLASIRRSELHQVFLKKTTKWKDGVAIDPVDLGAASPVRAKFSQDVLVRSVQAVQAYWRKLIFSGQAVPPVELTHDGDILNYVGNRRGAIGYISPTTVTEGEPVPVAEEPMAAPAFLGGELNAAMSYGTQKYDAAATKDLTYRGMDLRYLHGSGWRVQAEYLDRTGDDHAVDLANGMSADAEAWYFQISKRFVFDRKWARSIEPVIQIDSIDWNKHVEDTHDRLTTAFGLVFSPVENYQLKFEYDLVDEKGPKLNNNKLWLAAVVEL